MHSSEPGLCAFLNAAARPKDPLILHDRIIKLCAYLTLSGPGRRRCEASFAVEAQN